MNKRLKILAVILIAFCNLWVMRADVVGNVDFRVEGETVVISYNLSATAPIKVFVSENGGDWEELKEVTGDVGASVAPGKKNAVWNIFKERPSGISGDVSFYVKANYVEPTVENLPSGMSKYSTVIVGHKAYEKKLANYSSQYAGDWRHQVYATATDRVSYSVELVEYDFITGQKRTIKTGMGYNGRVPRKTHNGRFKAEPAEPSFSLSVNKNGKLCIDGRVVNLNQ